MSKKRWSNKLKKKKKKSFYSNIKKKFREWQRCHGEKHRASGENALTLAVSGFSATMYMKLRLTRSVPLQMQMMQPSRSASVFPVASNEDRILGSWEKTGSGRRINGCTVRWRQKVREKKEEKCSERKQRSEVACKRCHRCQESLIFKELLVKMETQGLILKENNSSEIGFTCFH